MKRVFAYLRVSSKGQIEGDGFDRQRAKIEAFCAARNWVVIRWFEESLTGTSDYEARAAFVQMLELLGPATADTVVVEKADRLARDLIVSELAIQEIIKLGGKIYSAEAEVDLSDGSDPTRVLIRQLLGALAQWDKSNLVARMRVARDRIRAAGGRAEGMVRWEDRAPINRALALEIFLMHRNGKSFLEISRDLNRRRVPSPTGGIWSKSSAHAIINRFTPTMDQVHEVASHELEEYAKD